MFHAMLPTYSSVCDFHSFRYHASKLWNLLPDNVCVSTALAAFKLQQKLFNWIMNAVLFVTNATICDYLNNNIHVYFLSIIFNCYVSTYLFHLLMYFNYFIDLFSSEILTILLSTNSK